MTNDIFKKITGHFESLTPKPKPWPPADGADKAYDEGMAASHRGDNPYPLESEEWQAWDDGWHDGNIAAQGNGFDDDDYVDRVEWKAARHK